MPELIFCEIIGIAGSFFLILPMAYLEPNETFDTTFYQKHLKGSNCCVKKISRESIKWVKP